MRLGRGAGLALLLWTAAGCSKDKGSGAGSAAVSDEGRVGESGNPAACGTPVSEVSSSTEGAVVAFGQYLYWLGGTNGMPTTLARRFDTKAKQWERLPSSGTPRMKAAIGLVGDSILVAGGMTGLLKNTATIERFDVPACAWKRAGSVGWKSTGPIGVGLPVRPSAGTAGDAFFVAGGEVYLGSSLKDFDSESVGRAALVPSGGGEPREVEKMPSPRGDGAAVAIGDAWWHTIRQPDGVRRKTLVAAAAPRAVPSAVATCSIALCIASPTVSSTTISSSRNDSLVSPVNSCSQALRTAS